MPAQQRVIDLKPVAVDIDAVVDQLIARQGWGYMKRELVESAVHALLDMLEEAGQLELNPAPVPVTK